MMKSYLRFEPKEVFGLICAPQCNVAYDFSGNLAITGCLQDLKVWNLRQGQPISSLKGEDHGYPYKLTSEVSRIERNADTNIVAAGCTNGEIRIFNYISKSLIVTLRGHRSVISSLKFDTSGIAALLASGSQDNDIILWDIVSFSAIRKLRGHKDSVTGLAFIRIQSRLLLVSVSKDTLLKVLMRILKLVAIYNLLPICFQVWDLETYHCVQTVVGHRCEIWSVAAVEVQGGPGGATIAQLHSDVAQQWLVLTGAADEFLRGYSLDSILASPTAGTALDDDIELLKYCGSMQRLASGNDKCVGLHIDASNTLVAAETSGKHVEIWRLRSKIEARKKLKRRQKRAREHSKKNSASDDELTAVDSTNASSGVGDHEQQLSDLLELCYTVRCAQRVRGFAFSPTVSNAAASSGGARSVGALVCLLGNALEVYRLPLVSDDRNSNLSQSSLDDIVEQSPTKVSTVAMHGHRSDVRAVCLSSDGLSLATCSSDGVKIWSTKTHTCLCTCEGSTTGSDSNGGEDGAFFVSMCFAPGGRFVVAGSKEGHIFILDTASGGVCFEQRAAHGAGGGTEARGGDGDIGGGGGGGGGAAAAAVWTLAVRPDGKGFVSGGADRTVRFWEFTVATNGLGMLFRRELVMPHDVLCVRYSPTQSANHLLVAVGLLDGTVRIFFDDSLKFFLTLYGHKLPVMSFDIR
jgi:U3 small nucleolar RNA-associated protein 12